MADCSEVEEGMHAAEIGFDFVGTTMSGYTSYTKGTKLPNYDMMRALVEKCGKPVIAEGGIWCGEELAEAMSTGAYAAVVGTAIEAHQILCRINKNKSTPSQITVKTLKNIKHKEKIVKTLHLF